MTVQASGEIVTFLGALDQGMFEDGGLALLGLVGPSYEDEAYPDDELYRTFGQNGVTVVYEGKGESQKATTVFVYIETEDGGSPYPTPDRLIDGLALSTADRASVAEFFGEPARSGGAFDVFTVNDRFLHFEYGAEGQLKMVTAMVSVPGL